MHRRTLLLTAASLTILAQSISVATAADGPSAAAISSYPNRPITLIVPYGPGGPTDIIGRIVAEALRQELGQAVVVDNRAGAGGNIGTGMVARAARDGYTLLIGATAFTINPALYRNAGYDPVRDFTPVATLVSSPNVFLASPGSGINSIADLVKQAKAKPGALNYASPGTGTIPQLAMELFKSRAGIDITHIPYNSAGQAILAGLSGTTPIVVSALPPTLTQVKSGKLVPLGVTSHLRSTDIPDTPTVEQSGYQDFDLTSYQVLVAPPNLPVAIRDRLAKAVAAMQANPTVQERVKEAGFSMLPEGPAVLAARIKRDTAMWADLIKKTGITAE